MIFLGRAWDGFHDKIIWECAYDRYLAKPGDLQKLKSGGVTNVWSICTSCVDLRGGVCYVVVCKDYIVICHQWELWEGPANIGIIICICAIFSRSLPSVSFVFLQKKPAVGSPTEPKTTLYRAGCFSVPQSSISKPRESRSSANIQQLFNCYAS